MELKNNYNIDKKIFLDNKKIEVFTHKKNYENDTYRMMPCHLYKALWKYDFTIIELRIVLYFYDLQYGFHNYEEDSEGDRHSQLCTKYEQSNYKIGIEIGCSTTTAKKALERLNEKRIVYIYDEPGEETKFPRYYLNKYFEFWVSDKTSWKMFIKEQIKLQFIRMEKLSIKKKISKDEKEMCEYVKSLTNELILENDRTQIINPLTECNLELDIYIPLFNKAIEYNGDYWHCNPNMYEADYFNERMQMYAYQVWKRDEEKDKLCKEKGIDLMVIWENDWKNSKEQCKKKIEQFLIN